MKNAILPDNHLLATAGLAVVFVAVTATQIMAQRAYFYDRGPAPYKVEGEVIPNIEKFGYYRPIWRRWPSAEERATTAGAGERGTGLPDVEIRPEDENLGGDARTRTEADDESDSPPTMPADTEDAPPTLDLPPEDNSGVDSTPPDARPVLPERTLPPLPRQQLPELPGTTPPEAPRVEPPSPPSADDLFPEPQPPASQGSGTSSYRTRESGRNRVARRTRSFRSTTLDAKSSDLTEEMRNSSPIKPAEMRFRVADEPAQVGQLEGETPLELQPSASNNPLRSQVGLTRRPKSRVTPAAHFAPVEPPSPTRRESPASHHQMRANPLRRG